MTTGVIELLTSWGLVIVGIEPISNLLVIPSLLTKSAYGVVEELLVLGIGCSPEVTCTDR